MTPAIIELTAPGISCDKCKANIEGDLADDPGVEEVTVDIGARRVRIAYDQDRPLHQASHPATVNAHQPSLIPR